MAQTQTSTSSGPVMHLLKLGDRVKVHGQFMTVIAIHPFGTIDVESDAGKCYRVTGLW